VPEYLLKASEYLSLVDFLENEFFNKQGYFFREPYFIISQEFREIKTYFSILNAISAGNVQPTRIANFAGLKARQIYPYLENLIRLGFIERQVPIFGNLKRGIYVIRDDIFDFWFNFVFKFQEEIERGTFRLKEEFLERFLGKRFERFCLRELVPALFPEHARIGRWWYKDDEIDVVALNERENDIIFLECKWRNLDVKNARGIITSLQRKGTLVKWKNDSRKEKYGIIARKIKQKEHLRREGHVVFDLEDILK
ncbi:MAG: ATP-binding protein, partial [Candidatus Helarchaeales archaeon]